MAGTETLRVFWQPGCSSCVKVKEFLTGLGIEYEPVNVMADPKGLDDLLALGAQSVPVVSRGKDYVFAQSLEDVSKFIGRDMKFDRLPPAELMQRWFYFLDTSRSMISELPAPHVEFRPSQRPTRPLRDLGYHIFQVPDAFLQAILDGERDMPQIRDDPPADVKTVPHVLKYADGIRNRLQQWWDNLADKNCSWTVDTFYGIQPGHGFLERSTWHSAQHARQFLSLCDELGIKLSRRISDDAYKGLPMPVTIWE
jgi:glutaredoxin